MFSTVSLYSWILRLFWTVTPVFFAILFLLLRQLSEMTGVLFWLPGLRIDWRLNGFVGVCYCAGSGPLASAIQISLVRLVIFCSKKVTSSSTCLMQLKSISFVSPAPQDLVRVEATDSKVEAWLT